MREKNKGKTERENNGGSKVEGNERQPREKKGFEGPNQKDILAGGEIT